MHVEQLRSKPTILAIDSEFFLSWLFSQPTIKADIATKSISFFIESGIMFLLEIEYNYITAKSIPIPVSR
jgi:hypothetical protein